MPDPPGRRARERSGIQGGVAVPNILDVPTQADHVRFAPGFGQRFIVTVDTEEEFDWIKLSPAIMLCIIIAVAGVLIPGIIPNSVLNLAAISLP